jgi:tetratricopeptide (TPR) repeat protein
VRSCIHFWTRAIEVTPASAQAWRRRGERYFRQSPFEFPRAFIDFATALELDPTETENVVAVEGKLYRYLPYASDLDLPIQELQRNVPDLPGSYFLAGFWELHKVRRPEVAVKHFTRAIELAPRWGGAHAYRALAKARTGDSAGAESDMELAYALSPPGAKNPIMVFFDACVKAQRGDTEASYRLIQEAADLGFRFADRMENAVDFPESMKSSDRFTKLMLSIGTVEEKRPKPKK